jgi:hypothetical protein
MRASSIGWMAVVIAWHVAAAAEGSDPGAARAQLQQGYALKQQGKCAEAIPHFLESVRLDRHPKGLLNLADCETRTGKLVSALMHAVEARDLATARRLHDFEAVAIEQLSQVEKRTPKLVLQLGKDAPTDTVVVRDGVELGRVSFGTPLPVDPGPHVVVARGGGWERKYEVTLAERDTKTLEVTPLGGTKVATPALGSLAPAMAGVGTSGANAEPPRFAEHDVSRASSAPVSPVARFDNASVVSEEPLARWSTQKVFALVSGGVGVAAIATSIGLAISAKASANDVAGRCPDRQCENASDYDRANSARKLGNVATGVFAAGAAAIVAGGVLWFTAPARNQSGVGVVPAIGATSADIIIVGQY